MLVIVVLLTVILILIITRVLLYFVLPSKQPPVFPELKKPYILAHQGGALLAPANTMAAFDLADSIGVDFLDIDVHMTKDGYLVGIHDNTVDSTTDGQGRVDSYALADLQKLDAGYWFRDLQGKYSYRGIGVRIPTLEEVVRKYATKYYFHFEIKDVYPKAEPSQIEEKLWDLIQKYHMEKKVIVTSFQQRIVDRFNHLAGGQVVVGAGRVEMTKFILSQKLRLPSFYRGGCYVLEIPTSKYGLNLKDSKLIAGSHRRSMQVNYWTIDDVPTMKQLIELGADGIFTNRPDLLKEVFEEMHVR